MGYDNQQDMETRTCGKVKTRGRASKNKHQASLLVHAGPVAGRRPELKVLPAETEQNSPERQMMFCCKDGRGGPSGHLPCSRPRPADLFSQDRPGSRLGAHDISRQLSPHYGSSITPVDRLHPEVLIPPHSARQELMLSPPEDQWNEVRCIFPTSHIRATWVMRFFAYQFVIPR